MRASANCVENLSQRLRFAAPALLMLLVVPTAPLAEEDAEARGFEIAREADERTNGFGDYTATMMMTLTGRGGRQGAIREMRIMSLETEAPEDGDKELTIFDEPRDVAGTALLVHAKKTTDDDIWMFLPAMRRTRRIAGNNKSGPFMGSEFAFEDFSSQELEKYDYRFLREEELDGEACYVVERFPLEKTSGYSRQIVWFDKEEYRTRKVDYYNRGDVHLKTLRVDGYKLYLDRVWFPSRYEMVNHENGRSTRLEVSDYRFGNGFTDRDFDRSALEGAR